MAREVQETSVCHPPVAHGFDEDAPLIELDDPQTEEITADTSGDERLSVPRVQVAGLSLSLEVLPFG